MPWNSQICKTEMQLYAHNLAEMIHQHARATKSCNSRMTQNELCSALKKPALLCSQSGALQSWPGTGRRPEQGINGLRQASTPNYWYALLGL